MPAGAVRARCTATLHILGCTDVSGASSLELEVEQHTCHSKPRCRSTTARKSLVTSLSAHTHVPRWRWSTKGMWTNRVPLCDGTGVVVLTPCGSSQWRLLTLTWLYLLVGTGWMFRRCFWRAVSRVEYLST